MCGWRKGVFWALPTHCPLPFPIPFFSHPSFLQSAAPTQAHAHGAKDGETGILAGPLCSATIPLSHSLLLFLPLSLCSINTRHSDLRSSAASGTLRWASRFQQTLSSLAWAGAAHIEKAKQPSADWSTPSSSSSVPSASFHTTFAPLCHSS